MSPYYVIPEHFPGNTVKSSFVKLFHSHNHVVYMNILNFRILMHILDIPNGSQGKRNSNLRLPLNTIIFKKLKRLLWKFFKIEDICLY